MLYESVNGTDAQIVSVGSVSKRRKTEDAPNESCSDIIAPLHHPYGIKPLGNYYHDILDGTRNCRPDGLGPHFALFPDTVLLSLLSSLDAKDLCRLQCASKAFYALASHDELWKILLLQTFNSSFHVQCTWKASYIATQLGYAGEKQLCLSKFQVQNLYSDLFFQSFYCANAPIQDEWLLVDNMDRVSASNLSQERFNTLYDIGNTPFILQDAISDWPALRSWTSDQYLIQTCQDSLFYAGGYHFTIEKFLHFSRTLCDDQPFFIFDKHFASKACSLLSDYKTPVYFDTDLFDLLPSNQRPDYRWLIIGPPRSGSSFHIDPNATNAWNAVIRGAKKWILFPPNCIPPGVHPSEDQSSVSTPVSILEWFVTFYPEIQKLPMHMRPKEGICRAGEVVFVPNGWWHLVMNLEESIAITQNFVSAVNVKNVLRFLRSKPDQVSGCAHAIRPRLGRIFSDALKREMPEFYAQIEEEMDKEERGKETAWKKAMRAEGGAAFSFSFPFES